MSLWLCCFLLFPACCLAPWKHDPRPGGSFILPSAYSVLPRLAMHTVSACLSMQGSSSPSPYTTTTSWDQAFRAVLVFYLQDTRQCLFLQPGAKENGQGSWAEHHCSGQACPAALTKGHGQLMNPNSQSLEFNNKKSNQGLLDKYCSRLTSCCWHVGILILCARCTTKDLRDFLTNGLLHFYTPTHLS